MRCSRFVLRVLAYGEACGIREEIVGDLLEEIDRGRSCLWLWQQVIGLFALLLADRVRAAVRARVRLTPPGVAVACGVALAAGGSIVPVGRMLEAWFVLYYLSGMLSLFAHMTASTRGAIGDGVGRDRR